MVERWGVRFAYLGRPIDQLPDGAPTGLTWFTSYEQFRRQATLAGMGTYDPWKAWDVGTLEPGDEVQHVNRLALHRCDAAVFWLPQGVPSVGVPIEIDRALSEGKPTVIFTDMTNSWFLDGDIAKKLRFSGRIFGFDQVLGAVEWLAAREVPHHTLHDQPTPMPVQDLAGRRGDVNSHAQLPSKAYPEDAGFDLTVAKSVILEPGVFTDVPTDLAIELPDGYWGLIIGRSSTLRNRKVVVAPGVIDNGWRGPIYAGCVHYEDAPIGIHAGERIAQLILMPTARRVQPQWALELAPSDRGTNGFGSSGN